MQESLVHVQPSLIADHQSAKLADPGKRALDHPPVPTQPLSALHSSSGYPRGDASLPECLPAPVVVVPFIRMQLEWSLPSSSAKKSSLSNRFDSVHNIGEGIAVVHVSRGADYGEGYSFGVDHNMALRRRFSLICRVRPATLPPFLAGVLAESTAARDQSILPSSPNLSSSTWCSLSHTPARCQSRSLRQQVTPLPHPISGGRYSHGRPVLSTKMMPVRAARLDTLGRPPLGFGGSGGSSGSITSHSSSESNGLAMC
jgi:hypothetical protein